MSRRRKDSKDDERGPASKFLDEWFDGERGEETELHRQSIHSDRWDRESRDALRKEMEEFRVSEERLGNFATQSGVSLFGDGFFSLYKAMPRREDPRDMRPTHLINHAVMGEAMELNEYEKLHRFSVADDIQAGLSAVAMEPHLEEIFDRTKAEQEALQKLMEQMQEYEALEASLEELMNLAGVELDEDGNPVNSSGEGEEGEGDGDGDMQKQKSLIEAQMQLLREQMEENAKGIDEGLEEASGMIQTAMRRAMTEALDEAELTESAAMAWGLDPGGLKHMSAKERIELASKLRSEKFRRIAELFGPMTRLAMSEQDRKVYHAADEIFDLEMGSNLNRALYSRLAWLTHPIYRALFVKDFVEKRILQYKLQGVEKVAKGSIIFCEDGSGSMGGGREVWAKAVGLCLLRIAKEQNRDFYGIHFGGTGEYMTFDFRGIGTTGEVTTKYTGGRQGSYPNQTLSYIDGVIEFAEVFFGGGTDFVTPLSHALDLQREQFDAKGRVDGDIVFCTDGYCGVPEAWLEEFKTEQARLGFRVWGIVIGGRADGEPLQTIADGRTFEIKDLTSGEEMREIFRGM